MAILDSNIFNFVFTEVKIKLSFEIAPKYIACGYI